MGKWTQAEQDGRCYNCDKKVTMIRFVFNTDTGEKILQEFQVVARYWKDVDTLYLEDYEWHTKDEAEIL